MLVSLISICRETPDQVQKGQKFREFYVKSQVRFVPFDDTNSPKSFLCNTQYFCIVDSDIQLNNTPSKCIFAFTFKTWLSKGVTMFACTCLFCL